LPISWPVVAASVLSLTVCATLWWAYFDVTAVLGERALVAEPDAHRPRLARDAYSYLHLPMVAGIVLLALGLKKVLQHVADGGDEKGCPSRCPGGGWTSRWHWGRSTAGSCCTCWGMSGSSFGCCTR